MTRIVIVGAGIAGVPAAYLIKAKLGGQASVTVISDKDYFHFVPSNPWIAMGGRKCNDTAFPIEPYFALIKYAAGTPAIPAPTMTMRVMMISFGNVF